MYGQFSIKTRCPPSPLLSTVVMLFIYVAASRNYIGYTKSSIFVSALLKYVNPLNSVPEEVFCRLGSGSWMHKLRNFEILFLKKLQKPPTSWRTKLRSRL